MQKESWFHKSIHPSFVLRKGAESDFVPLIDSINPDYEKPTDTSGKKSWWTQPEGGASPPIHERHFMDVSPEELHAAHPKQIDPQDGLRIRAPALSDVDLHKRIGALVKSGVIVPWQITPEAYEEQSEYQNTDPRWTPWEDTEAAAQLHAFHGTKPGQSAVLTDSAGRMFINVRIQGKDGATWFTQPFYLSSGGGGKGEDVHATDYVRPGDWIPYFGHQEESHDRLFDTGRTGWLMKDEGIGDRYHSKMFQHIGNYLNHVFGDMTQHRQAIQNNSSPSSTPESIPMYGSEWTMNPSGTPSVGRFIGGQHLMDTINSAEFSPQDRAQMQQMGRDLSESSQKPQSQQRYKQWIQSRIARKIGLIEGDGKAYFDHPDFQKPLEARESGIEWPNGQRRFTPAPPTATPALDNKGIRNEWRPDLDRQQPPAMPSPEATPAPVASVTPQKTWFQSLFGAKFSTPEPTPKPGGFTTPEPTPKPGGFTTPEPTPKPGGFTTPEPTPKPGGFTTPEPTPKPEGFRPPPAVPTPVKPVTPKPYFSVGLGGPRVSRP